MSSSPIRTQSDTHPHVAAGAFSPIRIRRVPAEPGAHGRPTLQVYTDAHRGRPVPMPEGSHVYMLGGCTTPTWRLAKA